jgi:hypothetical protein
LKADTINSLTTKFLRAQGLNEFSAHATRGACATSLITRGIEPALVQALGDWQSGDCFNKFYNRVRVSSACSIAQVLIPQGGAPSGAMPAVPPALLL